MTNLHLVSDTPQPCICRPEDGIACEVAEGIMDKIHDVLRTAAIEPNFKAYVQLKTELRNHYVDREARE